MATHVLRMLGFVLGTVLYSFIAVLLARKWKAGRVERYAFFAAAAAGLWHAASGIALFHRLNAVREGGWLAVVMDELALAGAAVNPVALLMMAAVRARPMGGRISDFAFAGLTAISFLLLKNAPPNVFLVFFILCVGVAVVLIARGTGTSIPGRFRAAFALALLFPLAAAWKGAGTARLVLATLAPPVCFLWFVYRYNVFGLLIGRRVVFSVILGVATVVYLFAVKLVADFAERYFDAFSALVQLAMIFGAAILWQPLYGWLTRSFSKRTQLFIDFSKRVIEEAVRILDLGRRVEFLAAETGKAFALRRVLLATSGDRRFRGEYGVVDPRPVDLERIESLARKPRVEMVHVAGSRDSELHRLLSDAGYNYLFPLWYEDHLTGLLLVDSFPRVFLDEDEAVLLGLSRQISHSIEAGRLIEEKISLEKALLQQEHLAELGKVSATIAHEVKNPLSSIKTLAQLMREDPEMDQRYSRDLSFIVTETDRLDACVKQLLTFARPAPADSARVAASELLASICQALAREHEPHGVRLEWRIDPAVAACTVDRHRVHQIVLNLLQNAFDASPPDSTVRIEASLSSNHIMVTVTDQGPGIPPNLQERIFEPFFTLKQKGTGLGLAIVKKNVRDLGGEIRLVTPVADGRGTSLTVTIPL